jgi:hypothetical protein
MDSERRHNKSKLDSTCASGNWEISEVVLPCDAVVLCRTFYITSGIFSSVAPCGLVSHSKGLWFDSTYLKYTVFFYFLLD